LNSAFNPASHSYIMAESVGLYYFSGTGNTELVAELVRKEFEAAGASVGLVRIDDVLLSGAAPDTSRYSIVGLGYPIHAFNAPRIVYDFVDKLPKADGKKTFLFKCPGDPVMKAGSTSMLVGRLRGRGYVVSHESLFATPSNVAVRVGDDIVVRLYQVTERKVREAVSEILSGEKRLQENQFWLTAVSILFSGGETLGARFFGRFHLRAGSACTLCGKCARECPLGNIRVKGGKVSFGFNCIMCLRCIYGCPAKAITPLGFGALLLKPYRRTRDILAEKDPGKMYRPGKISRAFSSAFHKYLKG